MKKRTSKPGLDVRFLKNRTSKPGLHVRFGLDVRFEKGRRNMYFIGVDLGTSSLKLLLVDENGKVIKEVSREYPLMFPNPGWSEQDPSLWWKAVEEGFPELLAGVDASQVKGIGAGGQMHGLVVLDADDNIIRPAILRNDGRTFKEVDYLNNEIGKGKLSENTANIAFAGFTAPKILWMKNNEPEKYARIAKVMLPKDYINYKLTGVHCCDYSDASGMLLLDVKNKCWSKEMLDICGISEAKMPKLFESFETVGTVLPEVAAKLGVGNDVKVCAGAGDNAAAAVGTGVVGEGGCNISLGTSGTVFISSENFGVDNNNALHSFAHADGGFHLMGCMLSAASCNKWFYETILQTNDYPAEQGRVCEDKLGKNHVYFLPYLMGERSPINDTDARGAFIGMTMDTDRADMNQAILEGVAFAIRDSFEVVWSLGVDVKRSMICGGGSKSKIWLKIMANVLGITLDLPETEQGPGYGGAMLAMVACGLYPDVMSAAKSLIKIKGSVEPDPELTKLYNEKYNKFKCIYPACKSLFKTLK